MNETVIVGAARTPVGRRQGSLMTWRPDDLAAHVISALRERVGIPPEQVEEVVLGCCMQVGEQSLNLARRTALLADLPIDVPGTTVDYQCGSGLRALQIAAAQIESGVNDVVMAGGVESMTRVPLGASGQTYGAPLGSAVLERHTFPPNGISAELIAERWGLSREELDAYSLQSHRRAAAASADGRFAQEIVPVSHHADGAPRLLDRDEGMRPDTDLEKLARLRPAFKPDGVVTAGSSSQISDGAAAVLLMERGRAAAAGLEARARVRAQVCVGSDPELALTGPIEATRQVIDRAGLALGDIDLFEVNEAFAPVVLAWQTELGVDLERVNVNGGAIALGHPLGCSGARLVVTLLYELERRDAQFGVVTLCCNGGLGLAVVIDRDV